MFQFSIIVWHTYIVYIRPQDWYKFKSLMCSLTEVKWPMNILYKLSETLYCSEIAYSKLIEPNSIISMMIMTLFTMWRKAIYMLDSLRPMRMRVYLSRCDFFLEKKLHLYFVTGSEAIHSWVRPRLCVPTVSPNSSNSCV